MKINWLNLLKIILSLIFALAFNNLTREVGKLDSSTVTLFLTFISLAFILGTLIYTLAKDKKELLKAGYKYILSGILVLFALSLNGLISSSNTDNTIFPLWNINPFSLFGNVLIIIISLLNFFGFVLFFYVSIEIIFLLKDNLKEKNKKSKLSQKQTNKR